MKILQVSCEGLGNGGVQDVIMNICRNIPDAHFDILLFTSERRYYDDEFEMLGGKIYRIPKYEGLNKYRQKLDYYIRFFRIFFGTYKILKKNSSYDVIHCHNDLESGICNFAAYFVGIKVRISHIHTANNKFSKNHIIGNVYKKFLQILMSYSSNVKISCTRKALISIFGKKYLTDSNSLIIPNAIEISRFQKTQSCIKLLNRINIVHVGRYCENKNQMLLIEILPYILNEYPDAILQLIGFDEEYKKKLQNKAISLCVESRVEFLPSNSDIKEVLEKASLFIFPSVTEGFGIALLEAQAMEVPCLVSDSVPHEVDCGLCKFLSLSEKRDVWATEAVKIIRDNHSMKLNQDKLNSLDIKHYTDKIKSIYEGEMV